MRSMVTNRMKNRTARNLPMAIDAPATAVKPKSAATTPSTRETMAQYNTSTLLERGERCASQQQDECRVGREGRPARFSSRPAHQGMPEPTATVLLGGPF